MISKFIVKKMADKAICNENVKESWNAHEQVFGPILTPAFVNDSVARVRLTAALNALSGRDIDKAFKKLKTLQKYCVTDADKAAWLYFMGLCADLAGDRDAMIGFYAEAGTYQHRFYLPYLKLAKCALADGVFEIAEDNYRLAIRCLKDTELNTQSTEILLNAQSVDVLATAYTNLTSCLTMMHKYEAAQAALAASEKVLAVQPGRAATKAVLYAAMGKRTQAEECLSLLEKEGSAILEEVKKQIQEIFDKKHPQFFVIPIDMEQAEGFWKWFLEHDEIMHRKAENQEYDEVISMLVTELQKLFPFMERNVELGILPKDDCCELTLADFFSVSLRAGYELLLVTRPKEVDKHWKFEIAH